MATITLKGNEIHTIGDLPEIGTQAYNFELTALDLSNIKLSDFKGKNVVLNIFPSVDTDVCAMSVRVFNREVSKMDNTIILCISKDLPFAQKRFCAAEGIENIQMLSEYKNDAFSSNYGVTITDGPLEGLMSRAVVVVDPEGKVSYTEQVPEIAQEPNYENVIQILNN